VSAASLAWELDRAGGIVAYVLLSAAVLVGLGLADRVSLPWPRFAVDDLHRFVGILAGAFVAVHVAATLAAGLALSQAVEPFAPGYERTATAFGVIATELLLALAVTNRLRKHMPYRLWRGLHVLNLVVWLAATVHAFAASRHVPEAFVVIEGATAALVAGLFAWRLRDTSLGRTLRPGPPTQEGSRAA
jgi:DMSO/TMAO reductase YedYZ heme-binding membrane subunit